ncbi:hypothetical protein ITJ86_12675 [Winogradskyella sp. F6397]|uniref:Uncharacterized protein n=1 Tax=Winogradskyella marina TaxID=2785530 RepID=A0ABS0EJW4_9FLAO|nr:MULTISPECIES: hypothetical protein [Winogradskyella]MBF8150758.1 hypothetical protein [Winogradskyella marina]
MVGLHALTHDDDQDHALHCAICDNATINNLTPALTPDPLEFSIENTELVLYRNSTTHYEFVMSNTIATNQLLSRPPPFTL